MPTIFSKKTDTTSLLNENKAEAVRQYLLLILAACVKQLDENPETLIFKDSYSAENFGYFLEVKKSTILTDMNLTDEETLAFERAVNCLELFHCAQNGTYPGEKNANLFLKLGIVLLKKGENSVVSVVKNRMIDLQAAITNDTAGANKKIAAYCFGSQKSQCLVL